MVYGACLESVWAKARRGSNPLPSAQFYMDQNTINTYNQLAKDYDQKTSDFWEKMPKTFFDKFLNLTKGKVLDVGSGPGRDGLFFKQRGLDVVCLDASEEMVKLCLKKGLNAVVGDFKKLPFEDNLFNGVWAYTSLLHSKKEKIDQSLKEIKRVLKNDGIFGLGMMEGDNEGYRQDFKGDSSLNQLRWFSYFSKEELEKLLKNNGFEITYFESFKPGSRTYLNFLARNTK